MRSAVLASLPWERRRNCRWYESIWIAVNRNYSWWIETLQTSRFPHSSRIETSNDQAIESSDQEDSFGLGI